MKIMIINPNSSEEMSQVILKNAREFAAGEFQVDCVTNRSAPPFVVTYQDIANTTAGMLEIVQKYEQEYDAFIIGCHGDPNLDLLREVTDKLVIGIGEASMKLASMLGHRFTILLPGDRGIPNKELLIQRYHLGDYVASIVPANEGNSDWESKEPLLRAGRRAMEEDHCEVIVLGCAGLGHIAKELETDLGIPVLDGVTCALILATGLVKRGWAQSKFWRFRKGM